MGMAQFVCRLILTFPGQFPRCSEGQVVSLSFYIIFLASSLLLNLHDAFPPFELSCEAFLKLIHNHLFMSNILGVDSVLQVFAGLVHRGNFLTNDFYAACEW
jgi:hypothetical protein